MSGKGDTLRPIFVSREEFDKNWEATFGRHPEKSKRILGELTELAQEMGWYDSPCKRCDGKGYLYWDDEQPPCPECKGGK